MGQSTDPAYTIDQDDPPEVAKKRSTSPIDAVSPRLPEFSFAQTHTSGLADVLDNESYISHFGYGVHQSHEADRSSSGSADDNPPSSAAFAYSLHSQYSRESQVDTQRYNRRSSVEDDSLDVVENDLDYLRSRISFFQGETKEKRKSGGPLPKRSSVQGVFSRPQDDISRKDSEFSQKRQPLDGLSVPERFAEPSHGTVLPQRVRAELGQYPSHRSPR